MSLNASRQHTTAPPARPEAYDSISAAIGADHDYFDTCYEHIVTAEDIEEKTKWRNQLTWTVARHAISEELTYYPTMEEHLGDEGHRLADEDREQHQAVKQDLAKLQDMSPANVDFAPLLERLMHDLHAHIEHEKNEDMPRLEALLRPDESKALAAEFLRTKKIVPTRSHPSAPNQPPLETLAGLLVAPVDRLRDLVSSFPSAAEGGDPSAF
ncbi:hypothetical protein SLS58_000690 [Diplodia intermedia]|uniref:Hemerythrin-like domain-containing protein n=1 Tax=Diplodia intermedia TaxID=856260 RepID=A0ABR3U4X2_9PEZI